MSLTEIVETALAVACDGACGAHPDQPCSCGPAAVHAARIYHARRAGFISMDDVAYVIRQFPGGVVSPGERAA